MGADQQVGKDYITRLRDLSDRGASWHGTFNDFVRHCERQGITDLPGNTIDLAFFKERLPACVAAGTVSKSDCDYVMHGLEYGFDLHVDESKLPGKKVLRNYKSAYENKEKVYKALKKRVQSGKTIRLGSFDGRASQLPGERGRVVPNGAVPKKLEPDSARPFSDHTKTGFNSACDIGFLDHSLDTYNEIATELKPGYSMRVEDIEGAYTVLPLAPKVWKYMYVWWYDVDLPLDEQVAPNTLYVHVYGDFGTSAMPGVWDKFFRCVKAMAALDGVLTLPMPHYVDDNSLIGPDAKVVDAEAEKLGLYLQKCGLSFKEIKSAHAAMVQLVLGFWWDSVKRTRTLEQNKLESYLTNFGDMLKRRVMTLHELQVLCGQVYRATMTLPHGSNIFLSRLLALMRGLTMPWHRRRVTAGARTDLRCIIQALEFNQGRGYFCVDHLPWAPPLYTDAMNDSRTAGCGWVSGCGLYDHGIYGSSASHLPIDALEGDAVRRAARHLGSRWSKSRVPIYIDNSAFQLSFRKGRSRVERLNTILRDLHLIAVEYDCVFVPIWISTHDNIGADALSRSAWSAFDEWCRVSFPDVSFSRCAQ